ncbi:conserved hypothetical protein [Segniliparus rotundus DSM 44985]|uniref:Uncharacterized protein n=1 Tax=Segniliparus rotundus (strain ATCC BAA-972 / CDC 1076 / CIP 108378 / DSM 44985 / JCM 13578) TaxID=640132 RepID=D6ZFC4_SEGRD|nr:hypothetical protein [Segniliparus rotundus]ADG97648.1 conserved hypothetical protein [Segniliparus rotundus DSM 44985]
MTIDIALAHDPEARRMIAEVRRHAEGRLSEEDLALALAEFEQLITLAEVLALWRDGLVAFAWDGETLTARPATPTASTDAAKENL